MITANEAKEQSIKAYADRELELYALLPSSKKLLSKIEEKINEAVSLGRERCSIDEELLNSDTIYYLKTLGYKIHKQDCSCRYRIIEWRENDE